MSTDNFEDVGDFHRKFGLHFVKSDFDGILAGPQKPNPELLDFRVKFLFEELQEFLEACGVKFTVSLYDSAMHHTTSKPDATSIDHPMAADALIDLVYVAMGTAHVLGYPWDELWDDVQRANMSKRRAAKDGSDSSSGREPEYDVIKPHGWVPPRTDAILRKHGFDV